MLDTNNEPFSQIRLSCDVFVLIYSGQLLVSKRLELFVRAELFVWNVSEQDIGQDLYKAIMLKQHTQIMELAVTTVFLVSLGGK